MVRTEVPGGSARSGGMHWWLVGSMQHDAKVGGAVEFARRGCTLVEGQQFTGHMSPLCFSMYAMLMGKFDSAHTIIEMQQPPIMDAHGIKSTRELQRVSALLSSTHALFIANNPSLV